MTIYVIVYRCQSCWKLYGAEPGHREGMHWHCECGGSIQFFYSTEGHQADTMVPT